MSDHSDSGPIPASLLMAIAVERSLREQQVDVFIVMPRVVRRVLQSELDIASPLQPPPHRKCCVIPRDRLLWLVARDELGVAADVRLPELVILVAQPEEDRLRTMTSQELYRHYWRLMFHARIDYAMMMRMKPERTSVAELRNRIDRLGQTAFDEIRSVLRSEQMLMRPNDDRNVYAEFVAVYQELNAFAPDLLPLYFPSLVSKEAVLSVIGPECNAVELLDATRPSELSPEEALPTKLPEVSSFVSNQGRQDDVVRKSSVRQYLNLIRNAEKFSATENNVRAALVFQSSMEVAPIESIEVARGRLEQELHTLVGRIQSALELGDEARESWFFMCEKLLPSARHGFWNANARLLYDLQNICFDHEHVTYKVDLLRWSISLGKSPLKRPLSNQRVVLMSKHLRAATLRVPRVEIDSAGRRELSDLLHQAADAAERILRVRLEPLIQAALLDAGFTSTSIVERVSLMKMVHELADEVVDRGFITLPSLRDTVSRNQLKMPDLADVKEFFTGDPLLRADRLLAASLDGVYSRGPFYLRWLQRVNSVAYGVEWGRKFTRFIALPFGLSFLLLKTIEVAFEHLPIGGLLPGRHVDPHLKVAEPAGHAEAADGIADVPLVSSVEEHPHHHHVDVIYSHEAMFFLGCVIFALIHFPVFRRRVIWFLTTTWTLLRIVLIDTPRSVFRWPIIDRVLKSFPMLLFRRFVLAPIITTFVLWYLLPKFGIYREMNAWWGLSIFISSFLILSSRIGRDTEELAREFFARTWYRIRVNLLLGLLTLIIDVFRALMDGLERVLYAVDEWLRFRSGESDFTLGIKAVFGLVWAFVHGVIRFCVTLLIEPQLNPIKHFPVVTVSHKLLLATAAYPLGIILRQYFDAPRAELIRWTVLMGTPGIFGFLAWELRENWRLYKANRSPKLNPVPIGDHGETLLRLLRPGFHSGTIPRLFSNQRRVARRESGIVTVNKTAKFQERLHHESAAVRHFIEREFIELLSESRTFRDYRMTVGHVELTTNRVLVTIHEASRSDSPVQLEFAEQSGWLVGVTREQGWLNELEQDDVEVFKAAVTGLYKLAAVDLVRERIEQQLVRFPSNSAFARSTDSTDVVHPYDISSSGLVVWPNGVFETEVYYPLDEQPITHPRPRFLARATGLEPLPIESLVFRTQEVTWEEWQQFWEDEQNVTVHSVAKFPLKWCGF